MDHIILGLLMLQDRTIYQLQNRIYQGLNLMYSSSMGSIQAACKKLLKQNYITYHDIMEKGRHKKVYTLTETGRQYFLNWVNAPMETADVKFPQLTKVYFMGFADKQKRMENIEKHIVDLKERYDLLESICKEGEQMKITDDSPILQYQLLSACFGRDFIQFTIAWFKRLQENMEEQTI